MSKWLLGLLLIVGWATAASAADLPDSGVWLSPPDTAAAFRLGGSMTPSTQVEKVTVTDAPKDSGFTQVIRVKSTQKATVPWEIQLQARTVNPVHYGDTLLGTIWLRGKSATGDKARVSFGLEKASPPWEGTGWGQFEVGPQWKKYEVAMTAPGNFGAGEMQINVRLGYAPQEVDVGPVLVVNYERKTSTLKLERLFAATRKSEPEPAPGRNLPYWAPEQPSAPALRKQISLNGTWEFTPEGKKKNEIPVPEYWDATPGFDCDQAVYERTVQVPADWSGQRVMVEFEGVNHIAEVFADGHLVGKHLGGWTSFGCDVTPYVKAGQTFRLKVLVKGGLHQPMVDDIDKPLWPMGWDGLTSRWGIIFPVWLRAYGDVSITETQIVASYRQKKIDVTYTLSNPTGKARTVTVEAIARPAKNGQTVTLTPIQVALASGETRKVTATTPWENPDLWMPDQPNLYHLTSHVVEGGKVIDQDTRRFGFREIWVEKNYFVLNGVRINLIGTSMHSQGEGYKDHRYNLMWPTNWDKTIDKLFGMNVHVIRFHQQPVPQWVLDVADEKGMMIIEESAVYARRYMQGVDREKFLANARIWTENWVKDRRNHASVLMWSAENECGDLVFKNFTNKQLKTLGDVIHQYDGTRPVVYEGDGDAGDVILSYHYPEGGDKVNLKGSIYQFGKLIPEDRPVSIGEFMFDYGRDPVRSIMQGTMTRGMRYSGIADLRPYTLFWTMDRAQDPTVAYIWKSLAPVAVFDKDYDDVAATDLLLSGKQPVLQAGSKSRRTLLIYNDTYRDAAVTVDVALRQNGQTLAQQSQRLEVPLGFHKALTCEFNVPGRAGGDLLEMVLSARKNEVKQFEEIRPFRVEGNGTAADSVQLKLSE